MNVGPLDADERRQLRKLAVRAAPDDGSDDAYGRDLTTAYARLALAADAARGVTLTADEVWALVQLDDAVAAAIDNLISDGVP